MGRVGTQIRATAEVLVQVMEDTARQYAGLPIRGSDGRAAARRGGGDSVVERHFRGSNLTRYGWPPLSKPYAARKAKVFGKKPVLVASGTLKRSVVGRGTVRPSSTGFVVTWSDIPEYGVYHATGSGPNPERDWREPNADDIQDLLRFARRALAIRARAFNSRR